MVSTRENMLRVFAACLLLALSLLATEARADRPVTDSGDIRIEDVMSYGMWFRNFEGRNTTLEYAEDVMRGRFKPRRDVEPWQFDFPIDWAGNPYKDENWQFLLHALYMVDPLLVAENRVGGEEYVRVALRIVEDWGKYHLSGIEAKYSWYNMAVGMRSAKIAYIHNLIARKYPDLLDPAVEQMFQEMAGQHVAPVLDGTIALRMTNHGLFQVHGVVALCREFGWIEACESYQDFARENLEKIIDAQFDGEGMHLEHSPGYHRFVIDKLKALVNTGWYEEFPEISAVVEKAEANIFWLLDPAGRFWGVGDTIPSRYPKAKPLPLPSDDCAAGTQMGEGAAQRPCVLIRRFSAGYVSVRSAAHVPAEAGSGLFYQGGFHSSVHKHLDDQTFELFENGQRVIVDSGYFNYQAHPMRRYMQSTRAHNTVEIGDKDFSRKDEYAYGSAVQQAEMVDDYFVVRGRVVHASLDAIHSRQLLYRPGNWLLVRDWVTGDPQRKVVQWFHLHPDAVLEQRTEDSVVISLLGSEYRFRSLSGCKSLVERGAKKPRLQGWYSPTQGEAVPNYAVGFECKESDSPLQLAITFSENAAADLGERLQVLRRSHPFR